MDQIAAFKQKLAKASTLRTEGDFDHALAVVDEMRATWPGNAHLCVLWAELVQLQESATHELNEAKLALQDAITLDPKSPTNAIELGHFLDAVEDNPRSAVKVFANAATTARRALIDAQIGQARCLIQLGKKKAAMVCLLEVLDLSRAETGSGAFTDEVDAMLDELLTNDSHANGHARKVSANA